MCYTKFEVARLLGARALQIKLGAPVLVKVPRIMEKPLDIAKLELKKNVLPLTVRKRKDVAKKRFKAKVIPEIPLEGDEEEITGEGEDLE